MSRVIIVCYLNLITYLNLYNYIFKFNHIYNENTMTIYSLLAVGLSGARSVVAHSLTQTHCVGWGMHDGRARARGLAVNGIFTELK